MGRFSVDYRLDALNIGLVSTVRASVGMGNLDAETDFLSAKITFCHKLHLPLLIFVTPIILTNTKYKCKTYFEMPKTALSGTFQRLMRTAALSIASLEAVRLMPPCR